MVGAHAGAVAHVAAARRPDGGDEQSLVVKPDERPAQDGSTEHGKQSLSEKRAWIGHARQTG